MLDIILGLGLDEPIPDGIEIIKPLPDNALRTMATKDAIVTALALESNEGLFLPEIIDHSQWGRLGLLRRYQPTKMQHVITLYSGSRKFIGAPFWYNIRLKR